MWHGLYRIVASPMRGSLRERLCCPRHHHPNPPVTLAVYGLVLSLDLCPSLYPYTPNRKQPEVGTVVKEEGGDLGKGNQECRSLCQPRSVWQPYFAVGTPRYRQLV